MRKTALTLMALSLILVALAPAAASGAVSLDGDSLGVITWSRPGTDPVLYFWVRVVDHAGISSDGTSHQVKVVYPTGTPFAGQQLALNFARGENWDEGLGGFRTAYYETDFISTNGADIATFAGPYVFTVTNPGGDTYSFTDTLTVDLVDPVAESSITVDGTSNVAAAVTTTFDNVAVNGADYDGFNEYFTVQEAVDSGKWASYGGDGTLDIIQHPFLGGQVQMTVGGTVGRSTAQLNFPTLPYVHSVAADVTVVSATGTGSPRGRIYDQFAKSATGDMYVTLSVYADRAVYEISEDIQGRTITWKTLQEGTLLTGLGLDQIVRLGVDWNGTTLTVTANGVSATYTPTGSVGPPDSPYTALQARANLNVSVTPTFAWDAPPGGKATNYRVRIYNNDNSTTIWNGYTGDLSYTVPPGVLEPNGYYRFRLEAHDGHFDLDQDNWSRTPANSSDYYIFYTGPDPVTAPFIDLDSTGVETWGGGPLGTQTNFWVEVHDAQGVPGNIKSVKVTWDGGAQGEILYYDADYSPDAQDATSGFYRTDRFGAPTAGDYTFTVEDWDGHTYQIVETLTANPIGNPDAAFLTPADTTGVTVDSDGQIAFDWDSVPGAAFYRLDIYDADFKRIYKFSTLASGINLAAGLFEPGKLYRYRVRTYREFFEDNVDNGSASPWDYSDMPTFMVGAAAGSHLPAIDIANVGAAALTTADPTTGGLLYSLQLYVKVSDLDGVPGNIKSVIAAIPGAGNVPLRYDEAASPTEGYYFASLSYPDPASIPTGTYTFTVTDFESRSASTTDELAAVDPLAPPDGLQPPDDTTVSGTTPVIDWSEVPGAVAYKVRIWDGWNSFKNSGPLTTSHYAVPADVGLVEKTNYNYRVYAYREDPTVDVDNFSSSIPFSALRPHFTPLAFVDGDNDGIDDNWETQWFGGTTTADATTDADGDTLLDIQEFSHATNPTLADTDGEGLSDGDEVNTHATDPLSADTDGDGADDAAEIAAGTDPKDPASFPGASGAYYVDIDHPDAADDSQHGASAETPFKTLHYAVERINAGVAGEYTLHVGLGTYSTAAGEPDSELQLTQPHVTIIGESGSRPLIDGTGASAWIYGIWSTADAVTIDNLEVAHFADYGIKVEYATTGAVINCLVHDLSPPYAHGIKLNEAGSGVTVSGNTVYGQYGGILVEDGSPVIARNIIKGNSFGITVASWGQMVTAPTIENNLITTSAIGLYIEANDENNASPRVYHNTFHGGLPVDDDNYTHGIFVVNAGTAGVPVIKFNLVTDWGTGILNDEGNPGSLIIDYNDVWGNSVAYQNAGAGANDISLDPHYINADAANFDLLAGSPAIDAIPLAADDPVTGDFAGRSRPGDAGYDMGAYEFQPGGDSDLDGMPDEWEVANGLDPLVDDSAGDLDGDGLPNLGEYQNGADPNNADTDGEGLNDGVEVNTYGTNPVAADTDGDGVDDAVEIAQGTDPKDPNSYPAVTGEYYVDIDDANAADDDQHGATASGPWRTLHYAIAQINARPAGSHTLHVGLGTYSTAAGEPDAELKLTQPHVTVIGESSSRPLIDGTGASAWIYGIWSTAAAVTIENLDVANFSDFGIKVEFASDGAVRSCRVSGLSTPGARGIRLGEVSAGVTVADNDIRDLHVGIDVLDGSPVISRNTIADNDIGISVSSWGALAASPAIENNVITADRDSAKGVFIEAGTGGGASPLIYHNTIHRTDGTDTFGIYMTAPGGDVSPVIKFNLITGWGTGVGNDAGNPGTPVIDYNDVWNSDINYQNTSAGANDISLDPLYGNGGSGDTNFDLTSASPAIDAIPLSAGDPVTDDFYGHSRPVNAGYDMGAFEYAGAANRSPDTPTVVSPAAGGQVTETSVTLTAGAFSDPDGDAQAASHWMVRRADGPYGTPDSDPSFAATVTTGPLTQHTVTGLAEGIRYVWRTGYEDVAGNIAWSDESDFTVGTPVDDTAVAVEAGDSVEAFEMVSFPTWTTVADAEAALGIAYDPTLYRIGTYDALTGAYREVGDGLKFEPGRAYWFLARDGLTPAVNGIPVSLAQDVGIRLHYNAGSGNGWNMIAPPNGSDYYWADVMVVEYDDAGTPVNGTPVMVSALAADNPWIDIRLWHWEDGTYFDDTARMTHHGGYWVLARKENVSLRFDHGYQTARLSLKRVMVAEAADRINRLMQSGIISPAKAYAVDLTQPPAPMSGFGGGSGYSAAGGGGGCFISTAAGTSQATARSLIRSAFVGKKAVSIGLLMLLAAGVVTIHHRRRAGKR